MGALTSQFDDMTLPRETAGFARWTMADVKELRRRFTTRARGYAVVLDQFVALVSFKKALHDDVALSSIFRVLDSSGRGRIDGLEFMSALALCCRSPLDDKVKFLFELFDFNMNAQLSQPEMVMMMHCTLGGMLDLMGASDTALQPEALERLGAEAMGSFDLDGSGNISFEEFVEWARSNREIMSVVGRLAGTDDSSSGGGGDGGDNEVDVSTDDDEFCALEKGLGAMARKRSRPEPRQAPSWSGFLVEPTDWSESKGDAATPPESNLVLEHVHGFRCADARSTAKLVRLDDAAQGQAAPGDGHRSVNRLGAVYPAGAVVVVADCGAAAGTSSGPRGATRQQAFYRGHTDDVVCVAVHPSLAIVATGQLGQTPSAHVWRPSDQSCLAKIGNFHRHGIVRLCFSRRGDVLASVGLDEGHSIALHAWADSEDPQGAANGSGRLVASGRLGSSGGQALDMAMSDDGRRLCVTFWCVCFCGEDAVVGTQRGELVLFKRDGVPVKVVQAHAIGEAVLCLATSLAGPGEAGFGGPGPASGVVTAGEGGLVFWRDRFLNPIGRPLDIASAKTGGDAAMAQANAQGQASGLRDLAASSAPPPPYSLLAKGRSDADGALGASALCRILVPKVMSLHAVGGRVLLGLRSGDVVLATLASECSGQGKGQPTLVTVTTGHFGGSREAVSGLSAHPTLPLYATCGTDRTVRVWDVYERRQRSVLMLPPGPKGQAFSVCFDPLGQHLAVGLGGPVVIVDAADAALGILHSWQHADAPATSLAYGPGGNVLAVGCGDHNIYLYKVEDGEGNARTDLTRSRAKKGGDGGQRGKVKRAPGKSTLLAAAGGPLGGDACGGTVGNAVGTPACVYVRLAVCRGHAAPVMEIDFGDDGRHLQSTATTGGGGCGPRGPTLHGSHPAERRGFAEDHRVSEMLFWDMSGVEVRQMAELRSVGYRPWTCVGGWDVQGVTALAGVGSEGLPEVTCVHGDGGLGVILVGDALGGLRLCHYPVTAASAGGQAPHKRYRSVHGWRGGGVGRVSLVARGAAAVSIGQHDRVVCQWRHEFEDIASEDEIDSAGLFNILSLGSAREATSMFGQTARSPLSRETLSITRTSARAGDGRVSRGDLVACMTDEAAAAALEAQFGSGSKEVALLRDLSMDLVEAAFTQMDADGSGAIESHEWEHFMGVVQAMSVAQREALDASVLAKEVTKAHWLFKARLGSLDAACEPCVGAPVASAAAGRSSVSGGAEGGLKKGAAAGRGAAAAGFVDSGGGVGVGVGQSSCGEFGGEPWRANVVEPSTFLHDPELLNSADVDLQLEWVNGARTADCRHCLGYGAGGQIVYVAASLGVVYDKNSGTQSFYGGDGLRGDSGGSSDLVAMAMHPQGKLCATGDLGCRPKVLVWDVDTRATVASLSGFHANGVSHLTFSPDGSLLASCGLDDDHSVALYDWRQGCLIASTPVGPLPVLGLAFIPTKEGAWALATCGPRLRFWSLATSSAAASSGGGGDLSSQHAIWGSNVSPCTVLCMTSCGDSGLLACGATDGRLFVFAGHKLLGQVSDALNPHRAIFKALQDDRVADDAASARRKGETAAAAPLRLEPSGEAAVTCLVAFSDLPSGGAPVGASKAKGLRLLSSDDSGLVVLWACLPDEGLHGLQQRPRVGIGGLLTPLLVLSVGAMRRASVGALGHRRLPAWATEEVSGVDTTPFACRYDLATPVHTDPSPDEPIGERLESDWFSDGGGGAAPLSPADAGACAASSPQLGRRLLHVRPENSEVRALAFRDGRLLVAVRSNEIYELSLEAIKGALAANPCLKPCLPTPRGMDAHRLAMAAESLHARTAESGGAPNACFAKAGMLRAMGVAGGGDGGDVLSAAAIDGANTSLTVAGETREPTAPSDLAASSGVVVGDVVFLRDDGSGDVADRLALGVSEVVREIEAAPYVVIALTGGHIVNGQSGASVAPYSATVRRLGHRNNLRDLINRLQRCQHGDTGSSADDEDAARNDDDLPSSEVCSVGVGCLVAPAMSLRGYFAFLRRLYFPGGDYKPAHLVASSVAGGGRGVASDDDLGYDELVLELAALSAAAAERTRSDVARVKDLLRMVARRVPSDAGLRGGRFDALLRSSALLAPLRALAHAHANDSKQSAQWGGAGAALATAVVSALEGGFDVGREGGFEWGGAVDKHASSSSSSSTQAWASFGAFGRDEVALAVGDRVEVRDGDGEPWRPGTVTALVPRSAAQGHGRRNIHLAVAPLDSEGEAAEERWAKSVHVRADTLARSYRWRLCRPLAPCDDPSCVPLDLLALPVWRLATIGLNEEAAPLGRSGTGLAAPLVPALEKRRHMAALGAQGAAAALALEKAKSLQELTEGSDQRALDDDGDGGSVEKRAAAEASALAGALKRGLFGVDDLAAFRAEASSRLRSYDSAVAQAVGEGAVDGVGSGLSVRAEAAATASQRMVASAAAMSSILSAPAPPRPRARLLPRLVSSRGRLVLRSATEASEFASCDVFGMPLGVAMAPVKPSLVSYPRSSVPTAAPSHGLWVTSLDDRAALVGQCHMSSHGRGETWGLACHPTEDRFVTAGDDKTVRLWRAKGKVPLYQRSLHHAARCACFLPSSADAAASSETGPRSERIAVGLSNGSVVILNGLLQVVTAPFRADSALVAGTLEHAASAGRFEGPQQSMRDLKFSPDGTMLAGACQDAKLYVWRICRPTADQPAPDGPTPLSHHALMESIPFAPSVRAEGHASPERYVLLHRVVSDEPLHASPIVHVEWGRDLNEPAHAFEARVKRGLGTHGLLLTASEKRELRFWRVEPTTRSAALGSPAVALKLFARAEEAAHRVAECGDSMSESQEHEQHRGGELGALERAVRHLEVVGLGASEEAARGRLRVSVAHAAAAFKAQKEHAARAAEAEARAANRAEMAEAHASDGTPAGSPRSPKLHHAHVSALDVDGFDPNGVAGDVLGCDMVAVTHVPSASAVRDVEWHEWTTAIGWPVQGLWGKVSDSSGDGDSSSIGDVDSGADSGMAPGTATRAVTAGKGEVAVALTVCRSHTYRSVPVVACGDDKGAVRLFQYPCLHPRAAPKTYRSHTSQVVKVRFLNDGSERRDNWLVSMGRSEQVFCLWKTDCVEEARERDASGHGGTRTQSSAGGVLVVGEEALEVKGRRSGRPLAGRLLPWMSEVREPTSFTPANSPSSGDDIPAQALELRHVYGYSGLGPFHRSNAKYLGGGAKVAYYCGGVGVVAALSAASGAHGASKQVFNHSVSGGARGGAMVASVLCVAVHAGRHLVATGNDATPEPAIVVWDENSGATLKRFVGFHAGGVARLAFSASGGLLCSSGLDPHHSIAVHAVSTGALIACGRGDIQRVSDLACWGEKDLVAVGSGFVRFFSLPDGNVAGELQSKKGLFASRQCASMAVLCVAYLAGGDAVSGQADGSLYLWKGRAASKVRSGVHTGAVQALAILGASSGDGDEEGKEGGDGGGVVSGGDDGLVVVWDSDLRPAFSFSLASQAAMSAGAGGLPMHGYVADCRIRSVDGCGGRLLVGTAGADLFELDRGALDSSGGVGGSGVVKLAEGHSRGGLSGVACHPVTQRAASGGDDGVVRVWDLMGHALVGRLHFTGARVRCLAFSPSGEHLAVGLHTGQVAIVEAGAIAASAQMQRSEGASAAAGRFVVQVCSEWVTALRFSPDGKWLAVGSLASAHLLGAQSGFQRRFGLLGHRGSVSHLDFSSDSKYLSTCSEGSYELMHWEVATGQRVPAAKVRDLRWDGGSAIYGWHVFGAWEAADGANGATRAGHAATPEVTVAARSQRGASALLAGDELGRLRLFDYPCPTVASSRGFTSDTSSSAPSAAQRPWPAFREVCAHASGVTGCAFSKDSRFVVSTGDDRALLQFEYSPKPVTKPKKQGLFKARADDRDQSPLRLGR